MWSDRALFQAAVAIIFGGLGDKVPAAFINDRAALSGRPFDPATMQAAVPHMEAQLRAHVALLSDQLADGRRFLTGDRAGLVDANAYYNLWFIRSAYPPAASLFEKALGFRTCKTMETYTSLLLSSQGTKREILK